MRMLQWAAMVTTVLAVGVRPATASPIVIDLSMNQVAAGSSWNDTATGFCNGYYIATTNSNSVCGGAFNANGQNITAGVGGSGSFLYEGTGASATYSSSVIFTSLSFAVTAGTQYTLSFSLTNADSINIAQIQPVIGAFFGSTVAAAGYYSDGNPNDQWQLETFTWTPVLSTSNAVLILNDFTTTGAGNDFGVAGVSVQATAPEPGTFALLGGSLASLGWLWRKRVRWLS
jgi:PEP-CTERM motif